MEKASGPSNGSDVSAWTRLGTWVLGSAAFGVAEVATAPDPLGVEPPGLLLGTVALYATVGLVGGMLWHLLRGPILRLLPSPLHRLLDDRLLSLAPAAVLLLPKLPFALGHAPVATILAALAAGALLGALLFLNPDAAEAPPWTWGVGALAFWAILLRWKDLARVAEEKTSFVVLDTPTALLFAAVAGASALTVAVAERRGRRDVALLAVGLFGLTAAYRLFQAPAYDLVAEPVDERLGRGTPVILIVLDTTRADHLSVYGYPRNTTPELEAFAEHAVVFERAVSSSSWTLPAHASLFTGLLPLAHGAMRLPGLSGEADSLEEKGIHRPAYPLGEQFDTLAEWLADVGYETGAVVANYAYMDPAFRVDQGFDDYFSVRSTPVEPRILKVIHRRVRPLPELARYWQVYRDARQINDLARRWIDAQPNYRFFLFLNYMEAHLPWGPHQPGLRYEAFAAEPELPARPGGTPAPDPKFRRRVDLYDSNIASLDAALGEFFDYLRSEQLFDPALIVVTSDHGESFGENAFDGHGKSLNEAEIRIPLLIKYPESCHAGRDFRRVRLVDVAPTLLHALGGRSFDGPIDGRPIVPGDEASAEIPVPTAVLAELYTDPREPDDVFHGYQAAIYDGDLKLVVRSDGEAGLFTEEAGLEIPVPTPPELEPWVNEQVAAVLERLEILEKAALARQSDVELDPEVAAGLEALGYI